MGVIAKQNYKNMTHGYNYEYANKYLEIKENQEEGFTIYTVLETEELLSKSLFEWNSEDIKEFLKLFGSISPVSLNCRMNTLKKFMKYISLKNGLKERNFDIGDSEYLDCIDMKKLMSVTLNYEQYCCIKDQLAFDVDGNSCNVRDKLIFELAWLGLTYDEIKYLKEEEVEFSKNEYDMEIALLKFIKEDGEEKIIKVEEPEVVEDIKKVMKETEYFITTINGMNKIMHYKDSDYLCKPIKIGRNKLDNYITNPSLCLQGVLRNVVNTIICEGIDVENLGMEDIRRSKLIYLLAEENKRYFDISLIQVMFDMKGESNLYWLRRVAKEKYRKE